MRLLYATSARYPSQLANRLQILSMAAAFARHLPDAFTLGILTSPGAELPAYVQQITSARKSPLIAWNYLVFIRSEGITHVYCREERLLTFLIAYAWLTNCRTRFFFEAHWIRHDAFFRFVTRHADGIIAIAHGIKDDLVASGIDAARVTVAPDGVDLALFEHLPPRAELRAAYGFGHADVVIAYTGSFSQYYDWKGVDTLLEAAAHAPAGWLFVLAGGSADEVAALRATHAHKRVRFLGQLPHAEVPRLTRAADLLVLPNKAGNRLSERYTSPLKLFEYMASGTPIIASDLPSIREILSEREATFFAPGDAHALKETIANAIDDSETPTRAAHAREKVSRYTWDTRAQGIVTTLAERP